ncbi:MAG: hypothetical protein H7Z41_05995 [Cytophagales bacterium]|nr:hypothetical protein [Armatimonadota bacterium]
MFSTTLFFSASSPGQVFRYFERARQFPPFVASLLLSDGVGPKSFRALTVDYLHAADHSANATVRAWMQIQGTALSQIFPPRVTLLWRGAATPDASDTTAYWGFTVWENGSVVETAENALPPVPKPGPLSWLPGMKRLAPPAPDIAWALAQDLPIERVPAGGLQHRVPIIDYATVAQLDQRSLLVENSPRLYRFPLE